MSDYSKVRAALVELPDDLRANAHQLLELMESTIEGIGDVDRTWTPPFLKLIQPTSGDIPDGAGIGSLCVNTDVLAAKKGEAVSVIPLRVWDSRQYWDPDPSNPKQLCNSPDAKMGYTYGKCYGCEFAKWVEGKGAACSKSKSFLAITSDLKYLVQMQFSKAQFKYGNDWESTLKKAGVSPYRRAYEISSEKNAKNPAYHMKAEPATVHPTEAMEPFLKALFDVVGADRKGMLERFYESVERRAAMRGEREAPHSGGQDESLDVIASDSEGGQVDENAKDYVL